MKQKQMRLTAIRRALRILALLVIPLFGRAEPVGMEALFRLDALPQLRSAVEVGSFSSYDRTGGNDDGFSGKYSFIRREPEGLVLGDLKGPGVIYRIWTPTPTDDTMEFLFDGEAQPRLTVGFREMFLGEHPVFPKPLVGFGGGGFYSYVPLPFATSCVVRVRAPKMQFYQINYALYAPGTAVETFSLPLSDSSQAQREQAQSLWSKAGEDISRWVAPANAAVAVTQRSVTVAPHSSATAFETTRAGRLIGLSIGPVSALAGKARDLLLRISFDDEVPSVLCPIGDFFGYAWGQPATRSLLVGTTGDSNYCYFPMPYKRSARIELVSERAESVDLRVAVMQAAVPRQPNEGKFYALWRRENPTAIGQSYTFLETKGHGHLVGLILQAQGFESGKTLFFEGDDETTLDGEMTVHGTGSEDFFNGGWYDVPDRWEKRISFPLSGCLGYAKHLGRTGAYRLFLGDAYSYHRSLRQTIEHAGEGNSIPTDYCSVTFFYSEQRPSATIDVPELTSRGVKDPAEIVFPAWWQLPIAAWSFENASLTRKKLKIGKDEMRYLSFSATGHDWFGAHFISPTCDLPVGGRYSVYIDAVSGPAQGKVQLFQNENPVADPVDLYSQSPAKQARLLLGALSLAEGKNNLMFKLVGKNDKSSGLGLDLISVTCAREE